MGLSTLNDALTKAFDPAKHTMADGAAVLAALTRIRPGALDMVDDPVARSAEGDAAAFGKIERENSTRSLNSALPP
jgi:hypothetical protein